MNQPTFLRTGAKFLFCVLMITLCVSGISFAQDTATKGGISGRVEDSTGAAIAGAKVTVSGSAGDRVVTADSQGEFEVQNLIPGRYTVKAEQQGFKVVSVPGIEVLVGKTSALKLTMQPGNISEVVEVTAGAATVDTTSTAIGANLNDQLYQNIPLARGVQSLFYLAPGASDSLAGGSANPSISGGSALDNLYIADGVNITDSAFGGLGVFSRSYGPLGTAINTTYVKEVQVKTGGFEPQYGQSQGGIVNIITKSGTNEYHGSVFGYFQPKSFESDRRFADDRNTNKVGKLLHPENYDAGFEVSGPVPHLKDKLLFFGSFNPTIRREIVRGAEGSGLRKIFGDETHRRYYTKNYAFKLDANLSSNHQLNFSIFGDPSTTNVAPFRSLNIDNTTADSRLEYGTRNIAVRYNGAISSSWTVSASFSYGRNTFDESGFANFSQITDQTQTAAGQRGQFVAIGLGFFEPTEGRTYRGTIDTQKRARFLGEHTFGIGYNYQKAFYEGRRDRSGPKFAIPATNADGTLTTIPAAIVGQPLNAQFRLRIPPAASRIAGCSLCPIMNVPGRGDNPVALQQIRGEFGNPVFDTRGSYNAAYAQDTWKINRYITALLGYRWEQEQVVGAILPESGTRNVYTFTGQWSPRFGITVDPFGKGTTKFYYNYGRFHEYLPLDAAERSLSAEKDFTGTWFAPDFDPVTKRVRLNQFGTVTPIIDSAHNLCRAAGGINCVPTISAQDVSNPIVPGTKLGYTNEHLWGFEQQLPRNWVLSIRFIDRNIGRIIEDAASVSPEGALAGIAQIYYIGNVSSKFDAAQNLNPVVFTPNIVTRGGDEFVTNTPGSCVTHPSGVAGIGPQPNFFFQSGSRGVCFTQAGIDPDGNSIVTPDGKPDGFPDPIRKYRAIEVELNKRFATGWQLLTNYRYATLRGNFEGHLRNDNGQTDPGISSLFDFTEGVLNLLGDQFATGTLNTERRHILNLYGSYEFGERYVRFFKGLNIGTNIRMESGLPISEFLAHPVYVNQGEIPVGGRGKLGRTPLYTRWDMHFDYRWGITEKLRMRFDADIFNLPNSRHIRTVSQFRELDGGVPNVDFTNPTTFYAPRSLRLGLRMEF